MHTRRNVLKLALGGAATAAHLHAAEKPTVASRIIDTHTHFYDPTRPGGVPWPAPGTPLYRPVYPKDWHALAGKHGIHETVVVEASKLLADNDWILDLAAREKSIVGFVGNLQPADVDFAKQLKRLAGNPIFRGIRVSGGALSDQTDFMTGLKTMADLDLSLDLNGIKDWSIVKAISKAVPSLRIMIDHCGGCGDPHKLKPEWQNGIAAMAESRNVFCKVSALIEMADAPPGKAPTETAYYLPVLDHLWQVFGPERVVFGSNWPVSDKGGSFDVLFKIVSEYFTSKGRDACEKYFWQNSRTIYKWVERKA